MFFTVEKIEKQINVIKQSIHRDTREIGQFKYAEGEFPEAQYPEFDDRSWQDFPVGSTWGGYDKIAWFRTRVDIPMGWENRKLALRFLAGPRDGGGSTAEALLYVNGEPLQGFDIWHEEAWLPTSYIQQGQVFVALRAWSGTINVPAVRRFREAKLVWIDEGAEKFYHHALAIVKTVRVLDENDLRRTKLLQALAEAWNCIDFFQPGSEVYYNSLRDAEQTLAGNLERLKADEIKPVVTAIGHSHIDMIWLWTLPRTREKASRTFSTVLHLMRQYPEYRFMHSSPQLYKFLKQDHPEIYAQVKERIRTGEWEITGGMWVEADTNLTSGESLIRQFLYGRRFIKEEFGRETNILWLPDVFGYSAALPQIIKGCGMKYFLTSKISWSQFNRFPYDTFRWRGLDGTEVLTHFITTPDAGSYFYTYNGMIAPAEVKGIWDLYQQKNANDELLFLYGWGDGGGGPTMDMIESARALNDLPGLPKVVQGTAEPYFDRLAKRLDLDVLPAWDGELYLELHRGTYTSQGHIKRDNRKIEFLFHNAEWIGTMGSLLAGVEYPAESLREGWERILLNQFHDVLPGSSIREVYKDTREDYAWLRRVGSSVVEQAADGIVKRIRTDRASLVAFNPLTWECSQLVEVPLRSGMESIALLDEKGFPALSQVIEEDGEKKLLLEAVQVPSLGYRTYKFGSTAGNGGSSEARGAAAGFRAGEYYRTGRDNPASAEPTRKGLPGVIQAQEDVFTVRRDLLENRFYRIELDRQGRISSLYDKHSCRQVLAEGKTGNLLTAFEDRPMNFDNWDIDIYYQEKGRDILDLAEAVVEEAGPLRGVLKLVWRFNNSTITQRMTIYRTSPRIDFKTEVDWHEHQVLLKAAFPVNVRATRATYDIQFGSIERPTHWNTSWDYARFEVSAHKWADLSEGNYGVALMNDCKYGYDIKENVMRLTLLKSGIDPDPTADQGRQVFTYSLLPHQGDWREGKVPQHAYELNNPMLARVIPAAQKGPLPKSWSFAAADAPTSVIETVKQSEDGEAWIVRVYENGQNRLERVNLSFGKPVQKAVGVNMVEEQEHPVAWQGSTLTFSLKPFEVKTFKIWLS